jgi:Zn-dependent protease
MDPHWLLDKLQLLILLALSLSVHEWAHAYSAFRLGDDTAQRLGRLTLNPLVHIDPIGTVLLPLLGVPFGWAKPVPVNPARFTSKLQMKTGMMITAAAGPLANLVMALGCIVVLGVMGRFALHQEALESLLVGGFQLNVVLALFNMLPIPPLDGSRVAEGLLPLRFRPAWDRFAMYGPLAVLAVVLLLPRMGIHLIDWPLQHATRAAQSLLFAIQSAGT